MYNITSNLLINMAPIITLTVTRTQTAACCEQIRMIQIVRTREK